MAKFIDIAHGLKIGTVLKVGPLMPGLCSDHMSYRLVSRAGNDLGFSISYMGVWLGNATATLTKEGVTWKA